MARLKLFCAAALVGLMALAGAASAQAAVPGEGSPLSPETGNIRGTVTEGGVPVEHLEVCAMSESTTPAGLTYCTRTEEGGQYLIYNARVGNYKVNGQAPWYLGEDPAGRENHPQVWYPGAEHPAGATAVAVTGESTTSGIDFHVHQGGEITGTVTDQMTGAPVGGIKVCPVWVGTPQRGEERPCGFTDSAGDYTIKDIDTDEYTLRLEPLEAPGYQAATYPEPGSAAIAVTAGATTAGIDPRVRRGAWIEGTASESFAAPVQPPAGIEACALDATTRAKVRCAPVDSEGHYALPEVPAGEYKIGFAIDTVENGVVVHSDGYVRRYYGESPTFAGATTLQVSGAVTDSGINVWQVARGDEQWEGDGPSSAPSGTSVPPLSGSPFLPPIARPRLACHKGLHKADRGGHLQCVKIVGTDTRRRHAGHRAPRSHYR